MQSRQGAVSAVASEAEEEGRPKRRGSLSPPPPADGDTSAAGARCGYFTPPAAPPLLQPPLVGRRPAVMVTSQEYFASMSRAGAAGPSAHPEAGQLPDDDAIQEAALELLASADLNVLTEAGLRALLSEKFKADLSAKQAFLKRVVKDFISNVGVHDDALTCNAHTYTVTLC